MPENEQIPVDESPATRIAAAVAQFGERAVADRAAALLTGANEGEEFLLWVGGRHAQGILDGAPALYWPEVWGARALLYAWDDVVGPAVEAGLHNQAWRVREMCCRVTVERELPYAAAAASLLSDEVARVRAAAARVIGLLGEFEQVLPLKELLRDPEIEVRRAAGNAIRQAQVRLDRTVE